MDGPLGTWLLWAFDDWISRWTARSPVRLGPTLARWEGAARPDPPTQEVCEVPARELAADRLDLDALREASDGFREPVVLRRLFAGTPAARKWSPEWFAQALGDHPLQVIDLRDHSLHTVTMAAFVAGPRERYLSFWPELFRAHPGLVDDLAFPQVLPHWDYRGAGAYTPFTAEVFFGHGLDPALGFAGTRLHCAPHGNVFAQLCGHKTWTFIHPRYSLSLRPVLEKTYGVSALTPTDLRAPGHAWIPRVTATLAPGDGLFNPPWMWHQVENEGFCIGVATREAMVRQTWSLNPAFSLARPFVATSPGLIKGGRLFTAKKPLSRYAKQDREAHGADSKARRRVERLVMSHWGG